MPIKNKSLGYLSLAITVLLWAAFALAMRALADSNLTLWQSALLRFGVPLAVLAWRIPRLIPMLHGRGIGYAGLIALGAGLAHFSLSQIGGGLSGAVQVGLVVPGLVPFWLAFVDLKQGKTFGRGAKLALTGTTLGIVGTFISLPNANLLALGALSLAALCWAIYTATLAIAQFRPLDVALIIAAPNALVSAIGVACEQSTWPEAHNLIWVALVLGLGSGILSGVAYAFGVSRIGAAPAAAVGALSPLAVVAGAWLLFDETLSMPAWMGLTIATLGALLLRRGFDPKGSIAESER